MPFSGLAFGPNEESHLHGAEARVVQGIALLSGEDQRDEPSLQGGVTPPWIGRDMLDVHPSSVFASLTGGDPLVARDPWAEASDRLHRSYPTTLLGPPPPRASSSSQPQVSLGDELSSASDNSSSSHHGPPVAPSPFANLAGQEAPTVPLHRRTGPSISEQQLLRILQGNQMVQPLRTEREMRPVPRLLTHTFPISVGPSNSARPTDAMTRSSPDATRSTLNRVMDAIHLSTIARAARREERQTNSLVPDVPMAVDIVDNREMRLDNTGPPVIFEGMDESCSICQERFQHDQRVCRLSCRHMFHTMCWESAQNNFILTPRSPRLNCPNCRGAGTLISVWHYIDENIVTQSLTGGLQAPNLLESGVAMHSMTTPPGVLPTSLSAPTTPRLTPRSARARPSSSAPTTPRLTPRAEPSAPGSPTSSAYGSFYTETHNPTFHIQTRLPDGRPSLIVDPGSVGNLCGDKWAKEVAITANRNGHKPSYQQRARPLQVSGVGSGSQSCNFDCRLPIGLRHSGSQQTTLGELTIPAVQSSDLPGLLGKQSLKKNRAVWDFVTDKLYFMGPGDYDLDKAMPPGTDTFQLETAPSGHSVLPCCEFTSASGSTEHTLTLISNRGEAAREQARTSLPPPPATPPVLPVTASRSEALVPPPAGPPSSEY